MNDLLPIDSPKPDFFRSTTLALLGAIVLAFGLCWHFLVIPAIYPSFDYPVDTKGVVDFEDYDWSESVSLLSPWNFYWNQIVDPSAIAEGSAPPADCQLIPGYWNGVSCGEHKLQSQGKATYHLRVKVKAQAEGFAFHLIRAFMNYTLYVNGQLIHKPGFDNKLDVDKGRFGRGVQELDIVLQVENPDFIYGGVYNRIRLGLAPQVAYERFFNRAIEIGIGACFFIMALYHFAFFCLRRRSIELLMFAGICTLILCRMVFVGQGIFFDLSQRARDEYFLVWTMHLTYYTELPMFAAFIYTLFPQDLSRRLTFWIIAISGVFVASLFLTPMSFWMYTAHPYHLLAICYVVYAYYALGRAILWFKREGVTLFALSGSVVSIGLFYDIGTLVLNFKSYDNVAVLGCFFYLIIQALVLAIRFSRAYTLVEEGEQAIKRLNSDLQEHERSRTAMFHNTSHELRTPLNGILGFIRLIRSGQYGEIGEKPRGQLLKVENLAHSLLSQVNTILDLAKSRQGSLTLAPTLFSLNELVKEVSYLSEALQTRQEDTKFEIERSWSDHEAPVFVGDQEKILTIVRNLLGNAFKFAKNEQEHKVSVRFELTGKDNLEISVEDSGIGIPPEYTEKIFEEFRQLDDAARRSYEGSGLGLAITKSFVSLMGGEIKVSSQLGQGSCFSVKIPAACETEKQPVIKTQTPVIERQVLRLEKASKSPAKSSQQTPRVTLEKPHRILVIDDNAINCEVIKDILEAQGYFVETALGGAEGLAKMESWQPELVLLDLMMPIVSGEDVLQRLREEKERKRSQIPVILITARASQEDRIHGLSLGADDYLAKPIMSEEMILRVRNSLNRLELTQKAAEKAAIEQDLAAVQMINETISRSLVDAPSYSFASFYQPAEVTGGDWLGVFHDHQRQRLYLMIGDVTGHGMKSALVTVIVAAAIKGGLEVLQKIAGEGTPEACLQVLREVANRLMCDLSERLDKTMTMAFLSLDLQTGDGYYLNAGHPPIYIMRREEMVGLLQQSMPLGYAEPKSNRALAFHLGPGESLLMFTDGLIENQGPDGRSLSLRRISKKIVGHSLADQVKDIVVAEYRAIVREQKVEDDSCFCIISRKPAAERPELEPIESAS